MKKETLFSSNSGVVFCYYFEVRGAPVIGNLPVTQNRYHVKFTHMLKGSQYLLSK